MIDSNPLLTNQNKTNNAFMGNQGNKQIGGIFGNNQANQGKEYVLG